MDECANPLNPSLYGQLKSRFGEVRVSNEGEPFRSRLRRDPYAPDRTKEEILDSGEEYRVCCPYCGDKRFRLYINHKWGTVDETGVPHWGRLINCFNEKCPMDQFASVYLKRYIGNRPGLGASAPAVDEPIVRTEWPGQCVKLTDLERNHPAIQYVVGRKFDPVELVDLWDVRYCNSCKSSPNYVSTLVEGRLVVPIYWEKQELVGWQTRAINGSIPKYYTMPGLKKRRILYNGQRAQKYTTGILVEGVTSAWRVGQRAVATLGKSVSYVQHQLLCTYFRDKALANMLDPDAWDDPKWAKKMRELMNPGKFPGKYVEVKLEKDTDPADHTKEQLRWHLRQVGLEVDLC
jgi:hypothetical protein